MIPSLPNSPNSCMPNNPQTFANFLVSPFITPTFPIHKQIGRSNKGEIKPSHYTRPNNGREIAM